MLRVFESAGFTTREVSDTLDAAVVLGSDIGGDSPQVRRVGARLWAHTPPCRLRAQPTARLATTSLMSAPTSWPVTRASSVAGDGAVFALLTRLSRCPTDLPSEVGQAPEVQVLKMAQVSTEDPGPAVQPFQLGSG